MRWKFILGLLTTCAVLMSMSYTMLIPFLPMYLIQDLGVVKADVDMWSGAIFAITFLVSGIMAPIRRAESSWHCARDFVWRSLTS